MTDLAAVAQTDVPHHPDPSAIPSPDRGDAVARYRAFIDACRAGTVDFRLTPAAEPTAWARCFGVFGLHLTGARGDLEADRDALAEAIRRDLRAARRAAGDRLTEKGFRQLVCFSLSALAILDALDDDPLGDIVREQLPGPGAEAVADELRRTGALDGRAQSGNQAMFLAVFLLHARRYLGIDTSAALDAWVEAHLEAMNRFGFWGRGGGPTHLHFQNGYHQYEILEYLGVDSPAADRAVDAVTRLADPRGHFAPYPGGGGCFDYDAVVVLTPGGRVPDPATGALLHRTAASIAGEQRPDGGFCESLRVRPRLRAWPGFAERLATARNPALAKERLRYALTLQRPRHDRVHTHWSRYQRRWGESDLWDSWFRMLTLARIDCAFEPGRAASWGFVDYPGIGWHPSLRRSDGP